MCHMTTVLKYSPLDFWDKFKPWIHTKLRHLIKFSAQEQGIGCDLLSYLGGIPVFKSTRDDQF